MKRNCSEFCEVCRHNVYDMEKHITTEEHKRHLRRNSNGNKISEARLPGSRGDIESPFSGRLRLGGR